MPFDRFLIAPLNVGLQTNLKPWLIPDDAFTTLQNAYVFGGRSRKRFGSVLMGVTPLISSVRITVGTTNGGTGNLSVTVPGSVFGPGQAFSIGTEFLTVATTGTPTTLLSSTGVSATHTFNTTTGALVIVGAAKGVAVYFYPAQPVMGLTQYPSGSINNHPS